MPEPDPQPPDPQPPAPRALEIDRSGQQFGLRAALGTFFALGLYLACVRQYDPQAVLPGSLVVVVGLTVGAVSGWAVGRAVDAAYWASLCAALGFLATTSVPNLPMDFRLAWGGVGAAAGAGANLVARSRPWLRFFFAGLGATLVMGAYLIMAYDSLYGSRFDAFCAPIVGVLVGVLIQIVQFVEADRRLPRYSLATWLICAVLIGNLAVTHLVLG